MIEIEKKHIPSVGDNGTWNATKPKWTQKKKNEVRRQN